MDCLEHALQEYAGKSSINQQNIHKNVLT